MTLYEIPGDAEINRGLVGYWKLDDLKAGTGVTTAIDRANFNDGTITGATNTEGINGLNADAMYFDGVDDYVVVGSNSALDFDTATGNSWSFWFNTADGTPEQTILQKEGGGKGYRIEVQTNKILFKNPNGFTTVQSDDSLEDDKDNNVVITLDKNKNPVFYFNGVEVATNAGAPLNWANDDTSDFNIGGNVGSGTLFYKGKLSLVRAYKRTLTAGEASKIARLKL